MNRYELYEMVRSSIINQSFSIDDFQLLFDTDSETLDQFELLHEKRNHLSVDVYHNELYKLFINSKPALDVLYSYYKKGFSNILSQETIKQRGRLDTWDWSYFAEGALLAYEHSKDTVWLDLVSDSIHRAIKLKDINLEIKDDIRGRVMSSWGRSRHVPGKWTCVVTSAGRIAFATAKFIKIIHDEGLEQRYGNLNWYLKEMEDALSEFDEDFRIVGDQGYYYRPTRDDIEPLNHALSAGRALLQLYQVTEDINYLAKAEYLANFFKQSLFLDTNNSYSWGYRPTISQRKKGYPNLTWKADVDASFALLAYENGLFFDKNDIDRFVNTFMRNIVLKNEFNCYISLNKVLPFEEKAKKVKNKLYGLSTWMMFAKYDLRIRDIIEKYMATNRELVPGGWFGVPRSSLAFACRISL